MEGRRSRARPKRTEESVEQSSTKAASNVGFSKTTKRAPLSRTRRSSRSNTATPATAISTTTILIKPSTVVNPTPVKELKETSPKVVSKTRIPTALGSTVGASGRISPRITTKSTSSLHSTFSSSTQKTIEIRSSDVGLNTEFQKLTDYIRRSVSKTMDGAKREGTHTPTTNTENESRYSRSLSRSIFNDDGSSKPEFSDNDTNIRTGDDDEEDLMEPYKSFDISTQLSYSTSVISPNCRQLEMPSEFGGWVGITFLLLFVPCIVYYLQWCCRKNGCELKLPQMSISALKNDIGFKSIFDSEAVAAYIVFQLGVFVLSALLCGRSVRLPADRLGGIVSGIHCGAEYKFNMLPIAVVMTLGLCIAEYQNYKLVDFVLQHQLHFCIYGFVSAFITALWAYIRANMLKGKTAQAQLNIYGKTGNFLVDYAQGREKNPKWFNLIEFKQVFYRIAILSTLLYVECYLYKQIMISFSPISERGIWKSFTYYRHNMSYDTTALLASCMLLLYVLDTIIFEHHLASSFELQGEGFGALLLLRYAATPYLLTAVARYFYEQQQQRQTPIACCYAAYLSILSLVTGLILKRISNAIKYKYRLNPTNSYFTGVETIHTYQGRRLLLGSFWGRLRQPNYTGDLIALNALTLPLFLRFAWPPLISILLVCAVLLHRTQRLQSRNMSRYHSSWVQYCNRVRYYLLPKVY